MSEVPRWMVAEPMQSSVSWTLQCRGGKGIHTGRGQFPPRPWATASALPTQLCTHQKFLTASRGCELQGLCKLGAPLDSTAQWMLALPPLGERQPVSAKLRPFRFIKAKRTLHLEKPIDQALTWTMRAGVPGLA